MLETDHNWVFYLGKKGGENGYCHMKLCIDATESHLNDLTQELTPTFKYLLKAQSTGLSAEGHTSH